MDCVLGNQTRHAGPLRGLPDHRRRRYRRLARGEGKRGEKTDGMRTREKSTEGRRSGHVSFVNKRGASLLRACRASPLILPRGREIQCSCLEGK